MSYSGGYKSGPPRGRGFMSRGSRGSSSGGGWRGNNRGGYSPPRSSRGRGGGAWQRDPQSSSTYEHGRNSRYTDMTEERFSSRNRDDGGFRRYSRQESPGYMEGHHRSPERKRMRNSDHFGQSHHRSHDSSSYDMNPRYSGSTGGGGYEDKGFDRYRDERRSYRDHHSGGGDRYPPPRDDYMHHRKDKDMDHHRHESMGRSSMPPPPPPMNPRHSASPRRSSFRGRGGLERGTRSRGRSSILRGSRGIRASLALRKVDGLASIRRKQLVETSYVIKKKILATARSQELQKKLRMQKIRRIKESQENAEKKEDLDEKEKENWDKKDEPKLPKEDEVKEKQDKEQEESGAEPVEAAKSEKDEKPGDEESKKEVEAKEADADDKKEPSEASQVTGKQGKQSATEPREVGDEGNSKSTLGRRFIRLQCPHCHERCITFKQYTTHLYSTRHLNAMSRLHVRHKQSIIRMRQQQRKQQREEEELDAESLTKFSSFCPVCKLNYRQTRLKHTASKMHQEMKKLLFPYCKVCGIPFKATLVYDKHLCSLEHIRREAYMEERLKQLEGRVRGKRDHDANDEQDADMDGFMIVDSVGDVDDAEDVKADKIDEKIDVDAIVGVEHVKKVEAQYCDLCQRYLPRLEDHERALAVHCRSSQHLRLFRELQRKSKPEPKEEKPAQEPEQNGKNEEPHAEGEEADEGNPNEVGLEVGEPTEVEEEEDEEGDADPAQEEDAEGEAKLWARVDNDLGELLRDAEPEEEERAKSSDDDESVIEAGRYDRFRNSEKNKLKQASKVATNGSETASATEEKQKM